MRDTNIKEFQNSLNRNRTRLLSGTYFFKYKVKNLCHNRGSDVEVFLRLKKLMCYQILTKTEKFISKTSVKHVTREECLKPELRVKIEKFKETLGFRLFNINFCIERDKHFQGMYLEGVV